METPKHQPTASSSQTAEPTADKPETDTPKAGDQAINASTDVSSPIKTGGG